MRLLILGGTKFLGRRTAEQALARGHEVTLFTRGKTNPELFPEAERLTGDRDGDLAALAGREWDAVVDMTGYVPRVVRASAELLRGRVAATSSSPPSRCTRARRARAEDGPLAELEDPETEDVFPNYGGLKAACERVVQDVLGDRATIVRPGLIVGPRDPTNRFTYWASRVARGGEVLAPGPPERNTQWVDVRDLAAWIVELLERDAGGVYNATNEGVPWGELLARADVTWVTDEFLREQEVGQWMELPLWIPDEPGIQETDVSRAVAAGLRFRAHAETMRDTAEWDAAHGSEVAPTLTGVSGAGLAPEREEQLLAAWHERPSGTTPPRRSRRSSARSRAWRCSSSSRRAPTSSRSRFEALKTTLAPADRLWVAWPKKASGLATDLDFETVQRVGLDAGLVDNKSAAVDDLYQAVQFVYRLSDRK